MVVLNCTVSSIDVCMEFTRLKQTDKHSHSMMAFKVSTPARV